MPSPFDPAPIPMLDPDLWDDPGDIRTLDCWDQLGDDRPAPALRAWEVGDER